MAERAPCRWCSHPGVGRRECPSCEMKADGEFLRDKWKIPVEQNRFNWNAKWWESPDLYPCSFSDVRGYISPFNSEEEIQSSGFFKIEERKSKKGGKIVSWVTGGFKLSDLPNYTEAIIHDIIDDSEYNEAEEPENNNGWPAEKYVSELLQKKGWETRLVGHLQRGYDVHATKNNRELLVEVKSSIGRISPSFTENEIQTWLDNPDKYLVALVENFNPNPKWKNEIIWINSIAEIHPELNTYTSTFHRLNRSVWSKFTSTEDELGLD